MEIVVAIIEAFSSVDAFIAVIAGILFGIFVGATPGLSPAMGVALLVPFSYELNAATAFIMFVSTYQAANFGGSITAILLNTPGTPSAVVTAIDGYALAKRGEAQTALKVALLASTIGGVLGTIVLIVCAEPIANFALKFGPAEYCMLAVFGASTAFAFVKKSVHFVSIPLLIGFILSCIGLDGFTAEPRLTFGLAELEDGLQLIPLMIGLFALGEVFYRADHLYREQSKLHRLDKTTLSSGSILARCWQIISKSSLLGTAIGVMPGAGATVASFISYAQVKKGEAHDNDFGEGAIEGIAASEAANSSSVGGALVPLLSLGIPGSATDAVLLGALTLHGLVVGPELIQSSPDIVYGIFGSLILANIGIALFGLITAKWYVFITRIPQVLLFQLIILVSLLGSYAIRASIFDCWICIVFGVLGYFMKRFHLQPATLVLGFILGDMIEENFRRALLMGGLDQFYSRPISAALLILTIGSLGKPLLSRWRKSSHLPQ